MPRLVAFPEFFALAVFVVVVFTLVVSALGQFLLWASFCAGRELIRVLLSTTPVAAIYRSRFAVLDLPFPIYPSDQIVNFAPFLLRFCPNRKLY